MHLSHAVLFSIYNILLSCIGGGGGFTLVALTILPIKLEEKNVSIAKLATGKQTF